MLSDCERAWCIPGGEVSQDVNIVSFAAPHADYSKAPVSSLGPEGTYIQEAGVLP